MTNTIIMGRGSYRHSCPNCGKTNTENRLQRGLPCPRCIPEQYSSDLNDIFSIHKALRENNTLTKRFEELVKLEKESNELIEFFYKVVGSRAWGAQRTWSRRLVRGDSFSIIAPTGVGKTTFGLVASLYLACRKRSKSYLVFPTTTLVEMTYKRISTYADNVGCKARIVAIHSKLKKKQREEAIEAFNNMEFDILITTASFARKYVDQLSEIKFKLVFIDDVDAVLRSAKSVDAVLKIVGFSDEDISNGLELLRLQRRIASLRASILRLQLSQRQSTQKRLEELKKELLQLERRAKELDSRLEEPRKRASTLIVSSATGRPRGSRVKLFRVLLGFEAGGRGDIGLRRVIDSFKKPEKEIFEEVVDLVKNYFRDGTLVYVPIDHGIEGAEKLAEMLREAGVNAEAFHSKKPLTLLEDFAAGKINVLVGVANYYGVLVRGIDLPERVRYAIFAGVPRHKFSAEVGYPSPSSILRLLGLLVDIPIEDIAETARRHLAIVRRITRSLSPAALQMIAEKILQDDPKASQAIRAIIEAYKFLLNALSNKEVWKHLEERKDIAIVRVNDERYILVADAATYLQASGRTSRLYAGGITLGLSVVIVDDERVLQGLIKRTSWMVDAQWRDFNELELEKIMAEIEEERKKVRRILKGEEKLKDLVKTALLIVESPNKARTIAGFFGQPSIRLLPGGLRAYEISTGDLLLTIIASGGHVYDLATEKLEDDLPPGVRSPEWLFGVYIVDSKKRDFHPIYTSIKRCLDCGYQFTIESDKCPVCASTNIRDSRTVVEDLRRLAWESDVVLIGTDPDTEGEKIGWDVALLLKPYSRGIQRLEFHEVTRKAIMEALRNLRDFDQRLVDAQIVRRIEDRWIGFTLSPLLWCHFWPRIYCPSLEDLPKPGRFQENEKKRCRRFRYYYNLSAGRVQTPVLGWIIERAEEAKEKINEYRLLINGTRIYFTELDLVGKTQVLKQFFKKTKTVDVDVKIDVIEEKEETMNPPPPYTTDSMIMDANRYLGLGAPETMRLAQNLFEMGLITYHRTDSTRVSDRGIQVARDWLKDAFGDDANKLFRPRRWGEGGAHEAIRPTRPIDADNLRRLVEEGVLPIAGRLTAAHYRLYDLIFRRFMSSQMREAIVKRAVYKVEILGSDSYITVDRIVKIGRDEDPINKGFTLVWYYIREQQALEPGLKAAVLEYVRKRSKVALYTEGDIIRLMKERGIGRPSTYAKIVETLYRRRYISRRPEGRVIPTHRGKAIYEYLTREIAVNPRGLEKLIDYEYLKRIPSLVAEERTRALQERMEEIEKGVAERIVIMNEVYSEIEGIARPVVAAYQSDSNELAKCISGYRRSREAIE